MPARMTPSSTFPTGTFAARKIAARRGGRLLFAGLGFDLPPGGCLVLTGPNGAGKSSLLRLIAGFGAPASGDFTWEGKPVTADVEAHRARLHYVGHQDALKPALTVGETLQFWQAIGGRAPLPIRQALAPFGLEALVDLPCRYLSAGQRRRVALSRLACGAAPIWLLDEPSVGLDDESVGRLMTLAEQHRAAGGIVILSTHQPIGLADVQELSLADYRPVRPPVDAVLSVDW